MVEIEPCEPDNESPVQSSQSSNSFVHPIRARDRHPPNVRGPSRYDGRCTPPGRKGPLNAEGKRESRAYVRSAKNDDFRHSIDRCRRGRIGLDRLMKGCRRKNHDAIARFLIHSVMLLTSLFSPVFHPKLFFSLALLFFPFVHLWIWSCG